MNAPRDWPTELRGAYDEIVREQRRLDVAIARYNLTLTEARVALDVRPGEAIDVHGDGTVKLASECKPPPGTP